MTPDENPAPTPREAAFTLKRAAEVAGVSPSTLRRNKETLREHGATITEHGWKVPMSALIASGLMRRTTPPDQPTSAPRDTDAPAEDQVRERIRELEREALELRHRAELAEVKREAAEQRAQDALRTLEVERRMITAGQAVTTTWEPQPAAPQRADPEPAPARRSWWHKIFS